MSLLIGSRVLRFQASVALQGLGDTKRYRQRSVARSRKLDAHLAKEKRRELVDQGLVVDHLVSQAYDELRAEGFRFETAGQRPRRAPRPAAAATNADN